MKKQMKYVVSALVFLILGLFLFRCVSVVFLEKNSYPKYRNFQAQDKVDVLILGSSHSDDGIDPGRIEKRFLKEKNMPISVFNYSIYGMRIEQMQFVLKELLKKQTPKLIVVETFAFVPIEEENREILARRAFDVFPLSINKIEGIRYCTSGDLYSYYFPIMKYHSRWKELKKQDVQLLYRQEKWQKAGKHGSTSKEQMDRQDDYFSADTSELEEAAPITDTEKESVEEILSEAEKRGISVLFVSVPFKEQLGKSSLDMIKTNNELQNAYVDGDSVQMLDMNRMWLELDFGYPDLYNEGHCNKKGTKKVTNALTDYLLSAYADKWQNDKDGRETEDNHDI